MVTYEMMGELRPEEGWAEVSCRTPPPETALRVRVRRPLSSPAQAEGVLQLLPTAMPTAMIGAERPQSQEAADFVPLPAASPSSTPAADGHGVAAGATAGTEAHGARRDSGESTKVEAPPILPNSFTIPVTVALLPADDAGSPPCTIVDDKSEAPSVDRDDRDDGDEEGTVVRHSSHSPPGRRRGRSGAASLLQQLSGGSPGKRGGSVWADCCGQRKERVYADMRPSLVSKMQGGANAVV